MVPIRLLLLVYMIEANHGYFGLPPPPPRKKKRKHSCWVREWILRRSLHVCNTIFKLRHELIVLRDKREYRSMLRMDHDAYTFLLDRVTPFIKRQNTSCRKAISPDERLSVALQFLAFGDTLGSLSRQFRIGRTTIRRIKKSCFKAIYKVLCDEYLTTPETPEGWREIARGFESRWNFPLCIGALDGKHINLVAPAKSGTRYYNYKGSFSVVLMALVDYNYEFSYVDVGKEGRVADGGIWRACSLNTNMNNGTLGIPPPDYLPGTRVKMPYVIVADDAFPLTENLMKPYSRRHLNKSQAIFNYRLSRARRISENAFGILASRFRVFLNRIYMNPDDAVDMIMAALCLHNFLKRNFGVQYFPPGAVDYDNENYDVIDGQWRQEPNMYSLNPTLDRNPKARAKKVRSTLEAYFLTRMGQVPWQEHSSHHNA